ncbi:MAG TPA: hypothetical protein VFQ61_06665 [Polyangiaceae bacterium]|nr:hypothetical protein [Polyangiaceae bacterium]
MSMLEEDAFIAARIAAIEARILVYEAAALAINNGASSYSFDDGQTRMSVTRGDLLRLNETIEKLVAQRDMWLARVRGAGAYVRPGF